MRVNGTIALLFICSAPLFAQNFLIGQITDEKTNEAVSFASIGIEGTSFGTASEIDGSFQLKIDPLYSNNNIRISCIGYKTKIISITSLSGESKSIITLSPELEILNELVVVARPVDAKEILEETIRRLPENYTQSPFSMEFYSKIVIQDTVINATYTVETVFENFSEGYKAAGKKSYRLTQKRETGKYFMKEKTEGMSQWPMYEVASNDLLSAWTPYQIVTLDGLAKINPVLKGYEMFDGDTVFVIQYQHQWKGEIYISSRDYAVVKHVTTSSGSGFFNRSEILYKKSGQHYFPYAANGDYLHRYKANGEKKFLKISNRTILKEIREKDPVSFVENREQWFPKSVQYNPEFWKLNYPQ